MRFQITKTTIIAPRETEVEGYENEPLVSEVNMVIEVKNEKELELIKELNRIEDPGSTYLYKKLD